MVDKSNTSETPDDDPRDEQMERTLHVTLSTPFRFRGELIDSFRAKDSHGGDGRVTYFATDIGPNNAAQVTLERDDIRASVSETPADEDDPYYD